MLFELNMEPLRRAAYGGQQGILDGRAVAGAVLEQVKLAVVGLRRRGVTPRLTVVQVGDDPASAVYVKHKIRACTRVGIESAHHHLPADVSPARLEELLHGLSQDPEVSGILLQLPLPEHLNSSEAMLRIEPGKDVDGFHPINLGCLAAGRTELEPCTPRGIMTLLEATGIDCTGKKAVVVGRSVIVGRPMAQMLVRADATVTVCHRHTPNLAEQVAEADVVVVATGVPRLVRGAWVKKGAIVIDVGISREASGALVGDVEFEEALKRASWITPVPGGVGPMTVATLMENTVRATCLAHGLAFLNGEVRPVEEVGRSVGEVRDVILRYARSSTGEG